jgi:hypothetical protein
LFPGTGSDVAADVAVAVFEMIVPEPAVTFATSVIVTPPIGPRLPIPLTVTMPFCPTFGPLHDPRLVAQETNVVPFGSGSVTPTFVAIPGPLFVTVIVQVTLPPLATGSGVSTFDTARSAPGSGVAVGVGVAVAVGVGVAATHGSWYWNGSVSKQPVSTFVTRIVF